MLSSQENKSLMTFSPENFVLSLQSGAFSCGDLERMGFNPYFPEVSALNNERDEFSQEAVSELRGFLDKYGDSLKAQGLLSVSIVGSVGIGRANSYFFGCKKVKKLDGYHFFQKPVSPDVDVEALVKEASLDQVESELLLSLNTYKAEGGLSSSKDLLGITLVPYERVENAIREGEIPLLVRYGVMPFSRINLLGGDRVEALKELSQSVFSGFDSASRLRFWGHVADRYRYGQAVLAVKRGREPKVSIPRNQVPSLYGSQLRLKDIWREIQA